MERYLDLDHDSDIVFFEVGIGKITVVFRSGMAYVYTDESCGAENVKEMIRLARAGDGLNSFIMTHVRKLYAEFFQYK